MAFPTVNGRNANASSANNTTLTFNVPASIAKDELVFIAAARDGTGAMTWGTGLAGWNVLYDINDTGTAACKLMLLYKIAEGSEGNLQVTSSSESWCARSLRISGHDPNTPPARATVVGDGGTGSTNPDPPNLDPADWGTEDTLWIAVSAGDGNVAYTAAPASYGNSSFGLSTEGTTSDRCALGVAERTLNASAENPGAFTRASEDWAATTVGIRPAPTAHAQPILRSSTFYSASGTGPSFSFTLDAGSNRRLLVGVGFDIASVPNVTAMTYGGVSMSLVTDGTNNADSSSPDAVARVTWWTLPEANLPSNGANTLALTLSATAEITVHAIVVSNTDQASNVAVVANNSSNSAASLSTTPSVPSSNALVLNLGYANNTPALTGQTIAGFQAMGRGQCALPTNGGFVSACAKGLTSETGSQTVTITPTTSVRLAMSTVVLAEFTTPPPEVPPIFAIQQPPIPANRPF